MSTYAERIDALVARADELHRLYMACEGGELEEGAAFDLMRRAWQAERLRAEAFREWTKDFVDIERAAALDAQLAALLRNVLDETEEP